MALARRAKEAGVDLPDIANGLDGGDDQDHSEHDGEDHPGGPVVQETLIELAEQRLPVVGRAR